MPKHPDTRQRRNASGGDLVLVQGGKLEPPKLDRRWLKVTKEAHDAFWSSDVALAVRPEDLSTLRRLFNLKDDHERMSRAARREPLVAGSQGQLVENPMAKRADRLLGEIRQLEERFGMTPTSRMRLAVSTADAQSAVSSAAQAAASVFNAPDAETS